MKRLIAALALTTTLAGAAAAQGGAVPMPAGAHHQPAMPGCPLHVTTLGLSGAQQQQFDSIRTAHMAEVKALPDSLRAASMKESMARAIAGVRTILTPEQLKTFDAAVTAHEQHEEKMKAAGAGGCACDCCAAAGIASCSAAARPGKPPIDIEGVK